MSTLQTKQLSAQSGVGREALRFYEREGLLPKPMRSANGYRHYPEDSVSRLRFIAIAQEAGFTLQEIKRLLNLGQSGKLNPASITKIVAQKSAWIDRRIAALETMKQTLSGVQKLVSKKRKDGSCPILALFAQTEAVGV